jgi:thymidylate kinase
MRILLEGISGSGKTSQSRRLERQLRRAASVEVLGEFSRGPIGRTIRQSYKLQRERFVRFHASESFADETHLMLLADVIAKAEEMSRSDAGVMIVDRLFDSWLCYTLAAENLQGLGDEVARQLHRSCSERHVPADTLTIFLDLDVATALERLAIRDGFGVGKAAQHSLEAVARQFAELYARAPVRRIDAGQRPAEVTAAILEALGLNA